MKRKNQKNYDNLERGALEKSWLGKGAKDQKSFGTTVPWCNNWVTGGSNKIINNVSIRPLIFSIPHILSWLSLCPLSFQSGAWRQSSIYWVLVFKNHLWPCHQIITSIQFQLILFSIRHFSSLCPYPIGVCQTMNVAHEKCKMWQPSLPMSPISSINSSWLLISVHMIIFFPSKHCIVSH